MTNNSKTPKPIFDFSGVSREWSQSFFKTAKTAAKAQIALTRPLHPDASPDAVQAYYDAQEQAIETIGNVSEEQLQLIKQVLKDVPKEWLIVGAPENIDWCQNESYDWIQDDHYTEILLMIQSGEARKTAKN